MAVQQKNEVPTTQTPQQTTLRNENRHAMRGASPCCPARQPERPRVRLRRSLTRHSGKGSDALPTNQNRHSKSRLHFWRTIRDRDTRQRSNQLPARDRRDYVFLPALVRPIGTTFGSDIQTEKPSVRSVRRDDWCHEPADIW